MEPINETTIRQLWESYLQGNTTLAEEQQLAAYFCEAQLPNDLLPYRALFRFFRTEAAVVPPESAPQKSVRFRRNAIRLLTPFMAAAAGVILFFALYRPANDPFIHYKDGQRLINREEAMQLAHQQLEQISIQIQRANNTMADKLEQVTNYTETINKYITK